MSNTVNQVLPPVALLRPQMPGVYSRQMVYDPTWDDVSYNDYLGQRIVPAVGSVVRDTDQTPLWVIEIDEVTLVPTYTTIPLSTDNDNVVSMLNYGNSVLRLYVDYRNRPYPLTPDSKCVFIGKSPRFYTLTRYPETPRETIISEYYDATGKKISHFVPLTPLNAANSSWHLPRCHTDVILDDNEEIQVKIFSEDGSEVFNALLFVKESAVINEDVIHNPTIVGMTVSGSQKLTNGNFFLYEKQNFDSLGLTATVVYDDGTTYDVPIDGVKCILYGQTDFISSFAGLKQPMTIKYFRSQDETIAPNLGDVTGDMISIDINVIVIPNTLATTNKIIAIPMYNASLARYVMRYWLYYADGRSHVDVSAYAKIVLGTLVTDSSHFGISQAYVIGVDMNLVDPVRYPTSAVYQQSLVIQFNPPNVLVKWTIKDSRTSPYILGQDNAASRRPALKYDAAKQQFFIPSYTFTNIPAFINSFYTNASPPYDPRVSQIPQQPTHFVVRDIFNGNMITPTNIPIEQYAQAFSGINNTGESYVGMSVMVEFLNVINNVQTNVLYAVPVDVTAGAYVQ